MRIKSFSFDECKGTSQEWSLGEFSLAQKTLLVGKNATGKSRTLNVIGGLAAYLAGLRRPIGTCNYHCRFEHEGEFLDYRLSLVDGQVTSEVLSREGMTLLDRSSGGEGEIFASEVSGGVKIRFQAPTDQLAAVARRDSIQHPFLEALYVWGSSLRHYLFGTNMGRNVLAVIVPDAPKPDERDGNAVVGIFRQAQREFGEQFTRVVTEDLNTLGYQVDAIGCGAPISVKVSGDLPGEVVGLYVQEKDLEGITDQHGMSQGMFRVLSILVHLNYFSLKGAASTLLIDDVGEGLDFSRSCQLIDLLRRKSEINGVQLIISTNDRFVMNAVPLEEWAVLRRSGNRVSVLNYENSRDIFEEFKYTGLSNFSLLEFDVLGQEQAR